MAYDALLVFKIHSHKQTGSDPYYRDGDCVETLPAGMWVSDRMLAQFVCLEVTGIPDKVNPSTPPDEADAMPDKRRILCLNWRTFLGLTPRQIARVEDSTQVVKLRKTKYAWADLVEAADHPSERLASGKKRWRTRWKRADDHDAAFKKWDTRERVKVRRG